jgi:polysaccharide export outer membrane protein
MRPFMKPIVILILLLACAPLLPIEAQTASDDNSATQLYIIQPNDILEIFVYKEPDLTRKVLVRPDGRISFPLVQDLQAAGLNPGELKKEIEKKLEFYLNAPDVTVIVEAIQSYRIFVEGKVRKPGPYLSEKPVTVLQALAFAGGFEEFANESDISIVRTIDGRSTIFNFNYKNVVNNKTTDHDIFLKSGDVVVVP